MNEGIQKRDYQKVIKDYGEARQSNLKIMHYGNASLFAFIKENLFKSKYKLSKEEKEAMKNISLILERSSKNIKMEIYENSYKFSRLYGLPITEQNIRKMTMLSSLLWFILFFYIFVANPINFVSKYLD
jgi:hypothetical protein